MNHISSYLEHHRSSRGRAEQATLKAHLLKQINSDLRERYSRLTHEKDEIKTKTDQEKQRIEAKLTSQKQKTDAVRSEYARYRSQHQAPIMTVQEVADSTESKQRYFGYLKSFVNRQKEYLKDRVFWDFKHQLEAKIKRVLTDAYIELTHNGIASPTEAQRALEKLLISKFPELHLNFVNATTPNVSNVSVAFRHALNEKLNWLMVDHVSDNIVPDNASSTAPSNFAEAIAEALYTIGSNDPTYQAHYLTGYYHYSPEFRMSGQNSAIDFGSFASVYREVNLFFSNHPLKDQPQNENLFDLGIRSTTHKGKITYDVTLQNPDT